MILEAGQDAPTVHVVNPGVDVTRFNPSNRTPRENGGGKIVGFVGRISSEKSPGIFVGYAIEILKVEPFARFVVVGDGDFLSTMKNMATVKGIKYAFKFTGAKYGDELVDIMRTFDVLINPSLRYESETFCIANVEVSSGLCVWGVFFFFFKQQTNNTQHDKKQNKNIMFSLISNK
jgi:glycosyltransferase involved in cell wall biosynthesis